MIPRTDLRTPLQTRPICSELGMVSISEADGSAMYSQGRTKVFTTVSGTIDNISHSVIMRVVINFPFVDSGPAQPKYSRHELYDTATVDFDIFFSNSPNATSVINDSSNASENNFYEKRLIIFLRKSLQGCLPLKSYPRMLIYFRVTVLCDCGSVMSVALNSCVLALMDAGLPLLFVPSSVSFCVSPHGEVYLDPTEQEEHNAAAGLLFTVRPAAESAPIGTIIAAELFYNSSSNSSKDVDPSLDIFSSDFIARSTESAFKAALAVSSQMRRIAEKRLGGSEESSLLEANGAGERQAFKK